MSKVVTCKSCGAENDVIFEACIYCHNPLPKTDVDLITNEELVSNASSWIEKIHEDVLYLTSMDNSGKKIDSFLTNAEIKAHAKKYLSMLQYRAIRYPELLQICNSLESRFSEVSASYKKMMTKISVGLGVGIPLMVILVSLLSKFLDK